MTTNTTLANESLGNHESQRSQAETKVGRITNHFLLRSSFVAYKLFFLLSIKTL